MELTLSSGHMALIDSENAALVLGYRWHLHTGGYAISSRRDGSGKAHTVYMHRLIIDAPGHLHVDHINGNKLDNRRANLRLATCSQNLQNIHQKTRNKFGYRGVCPSGRLNRPYQAQLTLNGKSIKLGRFKTVEDAARAAEEGRCRFFSHYISVEDREALP